MFATTPGSVAAPAPVEPALRIVLREREGNSIPNPVTVHNYPQCNSPHSLWPTFRHVWGGQWELEIPAKVASQKTVAPWKYRINHYSRVVLF